MHLFFLYDNNNIMKKILFIICLFSYYKVYAISNITIDNNDLIPSFNSNTKIYNYYTNKDSVRIKIDNKIKEVSLVDGKNKFEYDGYILKIFKNYNKENNNEVYLTSLTIMGYDINFDKDIYEYYIEISDEDNLIIDYELSNDNGFVIISGNGNFNKNDNIITINVNDKYEYKIHACKTMNVSKINNTKKETITIKKETAKYIIIAISCTIVFLFTYLMFNKTSFYI